MQQEGVIVLPHSPGNPRGTGLCSSAGSDWLAIPQPKGLGFRV